MVLNLRSVIWRCKSACNKCPHLIKISVPACSYDRCIVTHPVADFQDRIEPWLIPWSAIKDGNTKESELSQRVAFRIQRDMQLCLEIERVAHTARPPLRSGSS